MNFTDARRATAHRQSTMKDLHNKSVLVIDDDVGMLRALTKALTGEGLVVASAVSPEAAVKYLVGQQQHFDLVITDLRMPFVDGLDVLYAVQTSFRDVPVIVITAFGSAEAKAKALSEGAFAFLEKPLDTAQLVGVIQRALAEDAH